MESHKAGKAHSSGQSRSSASAVNHLPYQRAFARTRSTTLRGKGPHQASHGPGAEATVSDVELREEKTGDSRQELKQLEEKFKPKRTPRADVKTKQCSRIMPQSRRPGRRPLKHSGNRVMQRRRRGTFEGDHQTCVIVATAQPEKVNKKKNEEYMEERK